MSSRLAGSARSHHISTPRASLNLLSLIASGALLVACGGGGESPTPPPPAQVAEVTLSPSSAILVPNQTIQFTAIPKDGSGNPLSGRTITWSSSAELTVSVSQSGLAIATAAGSATITASSEGKNASTVVTVNPGGFTTPTGGTVQAYAGAVRLIFPAGALAAATAITVSQVASPPSQSGLVTGTVFELGPNGATFAVPVTIELAYSVPNVPAGVNPAQLRLHRFSAGAWAPVAGSTVDTQARVVNGQTGSFSMYGVIAVQAPVQTVTVETAGPLAIGATRQMTATLRDNGGNILTGRAVVWNSTVPTVAAVSQSGVVTALTAGTTLIRATSENITGEATVTVPAAGRVWRRVIGHPVEAWGSNVRASTEALGRTWVVTGFEPTIIRSTTDGTNWTAFDPTTVGLPARQACGSQGGNCGYGFAGTTTELVVTMHMRLEGGGLNAAGHGGELWTVRGNGQTWTSQAPTTSGLNQSPPSPSPRNFRAMYLVGGAAWGDRTVVVAGAQWWVPFSTGDQSFLSLTTDVTKSWQAFARDDQTFTGNHRLSGVVGSPLGFFAVGNRVNLFQLWQSSNGMDWTARNHPATQAAAFSTSELPVILYGPTGLVVARRNAESKMTTWRSVDGANWTETQLPDVSSGSARGLVAGGKYILYAFADDLVWISNDGQSWELVANSPAMATIIAVGSKLIGITGLGIVWELDL